MAEEHPNVYMLEVDLESLRKSLIGIVENLIICQRNDGRIETQYKVYNRYRHPLPGGVYCTEYFTSAETITVTVGEVCDDFWHVVLERTHYRTITPSNNTFNTYYGFSVLKDSHRTTRIENSIGKYLLGFIIPVETVNDLEPKYEYPLELHKDIYKLMEKEKKDMCETFTLNDGAVKIVGKVDRIELVGPTGEYAVIHGRIDYKAPVDCAETFAKAMLKAQRDQFVKACQSPLDYERIIYSNGVTTILWKDGTKTTVRPAEGEVVSPGAGVAYAFMKKALGNGNAHNKILREEVPKAMLREAQRIQKKENKYAKAVKKNGETENS